MSGLAKTTVELLDEQKTSHDLRNQMQKLIADKEELAIYLKVVTDTLEYLKGPDWDTVKNARKLIAKHRGE